MSTYTLKDVKFMRFCREGAEIFSTCSKQQYMSIIVDCQGRIESTGYNGVPKGMTHCTDGGCPRVVNNVPPGTPYDHGDGLCYAIHSEINCLIHSDATKRQGGTMYVNGVPCFGCAKTIANSGLSRLVYLEEGFTRLDSDDTFRVLTRTGITVIGLPLEDLNVQRLLPSAHPH